MVVIYLWDVVNAHRTSRSWQWVYPCAITFRFGESSYPAWKHGGFSVTVRPEPLMYVIKNPRWPNFNRRFMLTYAKKPIQFLECLANIVHRSTVWLAWPTRPESIARNNGLPATSAFIHFLNALSGICHRKISGVTWNLGRAKLKVFAAVLLKLFPMAYNETLDEGHWPNWMLVKCSAGVKRAVNWKV